MNHTASACSKYSVFSWKKCGFQTHSITQLLIIWGTSFCVFQKSELTELLTSSRSQCSWSKEGKDKKWLKKTVVLDNNNCPKWVQHQTRFSFNWMLLGFILSKSLSPESYVSRATASFWGLSLTSCGPHLQALFAYGRKIAAQTPEVAVSLSCFRWIALLSATT